MKMPSRVHSSCANCKFYNTCQHKQMVAIAALPATQDLAAGVLRNEQTITINIDGNTAVQINKEDFSKKITEAIYKNTFMFGA